MTGPNHSAGNCKVATGRGVTQTSLSVSTILYEFKTGFQHKSSIVSTAYIFDLICSSIMGGFMASGQGVVEHYYRVCECVWQQPCVTANPRFRPKMTNTLP